MKTLKKHENLQRLIQQALKTGSYRFSKHAFTRLCQRKVTVLEVEEAILNGTHEERKDVFSKKFNAWNYAIRGSTLDGKILRVAVTFLSKDMLIVTIIDVSEGKKKRKK